MKYLISVIFILFSFSTSAHELAVVDVDYLFKNSKSGKSIQKKFDKINKDMAENFKKKEVSFKKQEKELISKKNVLAVEEFNTEVKNFEKKIKDYNVKKTKTVNDFKFNKSKEYADLYKIINDILVNFSKENNISSMLDRKNVIMTKSDNDITEKILSILNKN
tara:strand:- start:275 stop:763 length:489 start_codon:yes stop_codon:yes gene_type:complete